MSVAAMTYVFKESEAQKLERLILLCHADHAHGAEPPWTSYAGVLLVAHETRASRRGVQEATKRLRREKRLIDTGRRVGGAVVYEIAVNVEADVRDRAKREAAEENERNRPRRGAQEPRPSEAPSAGAVPAPVAGAEAAPAGGADDDAGAEFDRVNAEPSAPEPEGTVLNRTAAIAAAAGEPAGGSSSVGPSGDQASEFWGDAAATLVAAGFTVEEIDDAAPRLKVVLRRNRERLPLIAWDVLAVQLREGRSDRSIQSWKSPVGTLAFGLGQTMGDHLPEQPKPPTAFRQDDPSPTPVVELKPAPVGSGPARTWDAVRADARRQIGDDSWDSWLSVLVAIETTDEPPTLWLAAPGHARSWIERQLLPLLCASAQRVSGDHTTEVRISDGELAAIYRQDAA